MKRYDGRTKPVPKPRPAKKKGVKQLNPKIPPAAAPHPEPSEYMCLVRWDWREINKKKNTLIKKLINLTLVSGLC